jgi:hypothetical protein
MRLFRIFALIACFNFCLSRAGVNDKWQSAFGPKNILVISISSLVIFDGMHQIFDSNSNNTVFPRLVDNQKTEGLSKVVLGTAVVLATLSLAANQ